MAKLYILFLLGCCCIGLVQSANVTCTDHCEECGPLGVICTHCGEGKYMEDNKESCSSCPTGCKTCSNGETCEECYDVKTGASYVMNLLKKKSVACPSNCDKCTVSGTGSTTCSSCFDMYTVGKENNCVACPTNCAKCSLDESGGTTCSTCNDGYFADNGGAVCQGCASNCLRCTSAALCSKCEVGFLINSNGVCEACPWMCDECIDINDITENDNPINSNVADRTKKCKDEGCAYGHGYHWHDTCEKCPSYCSGCDKAGACESCLDGAGLSFKDPITPSCEVCPDKCNKCFWKENKNSMYCSECAELYALNPDTGECVACDENCLGSCKWYGAYTFVYTAQDHIVTVNGPVCENCKIGYGLAEDGTCKSCPVGCNTCYVNFMDRAISAQYVDWLECAGAHEKCLYHVECDGDLHCHYRNTKDFDPRPISGRLATIYTGSARKRRDVNNSHRTKRAMYGFLTQAEFDASNTAGYPWIENSCCQYGYGSVSKSETFADGSSFAIQVCQTCQVANCNNCDGDLTSCKKCDNGFAWSSGDKECKVCEVNGCLNCDTDVTKCDECDPYVRYDNHFVEVLKLETSCLVCPRNCEASAEYLQDPFNTAKRCEYNTQHERAECSSTEYCLPGTSLTITGLCAYCGENCDVCIWVYDDTLGYQSEIPRCQTCDEGFAVDEVYDCRVCPENCDVCSWNSAQNRMDCGEGKCAQGYTNHPNNGGCIFCGAGCVECSVASDALDRTCTSQCLAGYASKTGIDGITTCVACPLFCSECEYNSEGNRVECVSTEACFEGYAKAFDGTCTACPSNTKSCTLLEDGTSQVDQCVEKYFRNREQCAICPDGCSKCVDTDGEMECTHCKGGFTFDVETKSCLACPENCAECLLDSDGNPTCQRCLDDKIMLVPGLCAGCETLAARYCKRCTAPSIGIPSLCLECESGYAVSEDMTSCLPCGTLPGCDVCSDRGEMCTKCDSGFNMNIDGTCSFECYTCQGADCGTTAVTSSSTTTPCQLGACWSYRVEKTSDHSVAYERTCETTQCTVETLGTDTCKSTVLNNTNVKLCASCCMGHKCNSADLTSNAPPAAGMTIRLIALTAALILLRVLTN